MWPCPMRRSLATRSARSCSATRTPTMLNVAPTFEGYDPDAMRRAPTFTAIWNLTGLPAASVCCGFSNAGLPIGMQIVGKPFDEAMVLRVGDAYQQLTDWHTRTPESTRQVQPARA